MLQVCVPILAEMSVLWTVVRVCKANSGRAVPLSLDDQPQSGELTRSIAEKRALVTDALFFPIELLLFASRLQPPDLLARSLQAFLHGTA
jgi:hypothetical protein